MSSTSVKNPEWFKQGNLLIWSVADTAYKFLDESMHLSTDQKNAVFCGIIHYINCLKLSIETNKNGQHAVAICLIRQCVEALTVIELGFLHEYHISTTLIDSWINGSKTSGEIRKQLERDIWHRYGLGLWEESWSNYFGAFCKAIQPYAHYSRELQGWQMALVTNTVQGDQDGNYIFLAKVGLNTYEANKASRITLLHCLLSWTLGKIITENVDMPQLKALIINLQHALAASEELCKGKLDWYQQFWAHEFTFSNSSYR
jgi:hypothetical protein